MLDALNKGFEEPQNPDEFIKLLRDTRINSHKEDPDISDEVDYCKGLDDKDEPMLVESAFQLQEILLAQLDKGSPLDVTPAFYIDLKNFVDICKTIDEEEIAAKIVMKAANFHLNFFDNFKASDFIWIHKNMIESLVGVLDHFNCKIPRNSVANSLQAETEHLLARYMQWHVLHVVGKTEEHQMPVEDLIGNVNKRYENALYSASRIVQGLSKNGLIEVEDPNELFHWENISKDYAEWLMRIGDVEEADSVCSYVEFEIPGSTIRELVGLTNSNINEIIFGDGNYVDLSALAKETGIDLCELIKAKYPAFQTDNDLPN